MEKLKTIYQCEGFGDYYKSVLNGGKYVDPDCIDDINTPYYNFLTEFLKKRESESCYENKFSFVPPKNAKLTTDDEKNLKDNDEYKIVVKQDDEELFRLTSDQFGFSGNEGIYRQTYGHLKYPLARINYLSKNESIDERNRILNKLINYVKNTRTLGSSFIWPTPKKSEGTRKSTYNMNRGVGSYLEDRVDLTLCEIKEFYKCYAEALNKEELIDKMKSNILLKSADSNDIINWLSHFETFENYVNFFSFESFVEMGENNKYEVCNLLTGEKIESDKINRLKDATAEDIEQVLKNLQKWTKLRNQIMLKKIKKQIFG